MSRTSDSSKAARWRAVIRDQGRSGLSVAAYCRRTGVPLSSFYFWRRKLGEDGHRGSDSATFAEVRLPSDARPVASKLTNRAGRGASKLMNGAGLGTPGCMHDAGPIELRLADGRCLVVRPGFDRQTLIELLSVLEGDA